MYGIKDKGTLKKLLAGILVATVAVTGIPEPPFRGILKPAVVSATDDLLTRASDLLGKVSLYIEKEGDQFTYLVAFGLTDTFDIGS